MSLDAVVFRALKSLGGLVDLNEIELADPLTGEYAYVDTARPSPPGVFVAYSCALANISGAAELREVFSGSLTSEAVLMSKVLHSGSHCGDMLNRHDIARLAGELNNLILTDDIFVMDFIRKLRKLIIYSESEGNPIVFT